MYASNNPESPTIWNRDGVYIVVDTSLASTAVSVSKQSMPTRCLRVQFFAHQFGGLPDRPHRTQIARTDTRLQRFCCLSGDDFRADLGDRAVTDRDDPARRVEPELRQLWLEPGIVSRLPGDEPRDVLGGHASRPDRGRRAGGDRLAVGVDDPDRIANTERRLGQTEIGPDDGAVASHDGRAADAAGPDEQVVIDRPLGASGFVSRLDGRLGRLADGGLSSDLDPPSGEFVSDRRLERLWERRRNGFELFEDDDLDAVGRTRFVGERRQLPGDLHP